MPKYRRINELQVALRPRTIDRLAIWDLDACEVRKAVSSWRDDEKTRFVAQTPHLLGSIVFLELRQDGFRVGGEPLGKDSSYREIVCR